MVSARNTRIIRGALFWPLPLAFFLARAKKSRIFDNLTGGRLYRPEPNPNPPGRGAREIPIPTRARHIMGQPT